MALEVIVESWLGIIHVDEETKIIFREMKRVKILWEEV